MVQPGQERPKPGRPQALKEDGDRGRVEDLVLPLLPSAHPGVLLYGAGFFSSPLEFTHPGRFRFHPPLLCKAACS
jgi:hypothetical protein